MSRKCRVLEELTSKGRPFVIGMVHVGPLPGSPTYAGEVMDQVVEEAVRNAETLVKGGVDAVLVENFYDVPYPKSSPDPAEVASMAIVVNAVRKAVDVPVGVNLLRNCSKESVAVAAVAGASFIRVNALSETVVADQGLIEPSAYELHRYIRYLGFRPCILADVHVKHAAPLAPRPLPDVSKEAVGRGLADAVVISGEMTGVRPSREDLLLVKQAVDVPVVVGSGLTPEFVDELLTVADGAIVGTYFKSGRRVIKSRVAELMEAVKKVRR
ncbi:MAG: BtpA/SgcQ family protein [Desulfurococcales archaeon]|nr:BtpA/SgcQ family protein [Desulfurococcales archaeon]